MYKRQVVLLHKFGNTNINMHYIISDKKSVDDFIKIYNQYKDIVLYFVLLPLMPSGPVSYTHLDVYKRQV